MAHIQSVLGLEGQLIVQDGVFTNNKGIGSEVIVEGAVGILLEMGAQATDLN